MQKIAQNKSKKKKTTTKKHQTYLLGVLGCKFEKAPSYFQQPRICQIAKFRAKLRILNFVTKNVI